MSSYMKKEEFYQHLCEELRQNRSLYPYYKLVDGSVSQQQYRKAYFLQRLEYIDKYVDLSQHPVIWDCGCGYGSTDLYFAMNGVPSYGTTIEFYADEIEKRKQFWQQFGDSSLFTYEYANVFDQNIPEEKYDYIILQDTLHHIEPLDEGLRIFYKALKKGGKLVLIEENGGCLVKRAMLFLRRGNKRVITVHDDVLEKDVLMGNENVRSEAQWREAFARTGFVLDEDSVHYIRRCYPWRFNAHNMLQIIDLEQYRSKNKKLCHYAFFGLNMVFTKK